jgi:cytidine deaminase
LQGVPKSILERLFREAEGVLPNSYAPYSGVHVAAAVLTDDGSIYVGVNVENVSYGLTICAERAAIASMVSSGKRKIKAVAIVADTADPLPPCGACRQVIAEFADPDTIIASKSTVTGRIKVWRLGELLPDPPRPLQLRHRA